ncbi:MAG TPA: PilZ domain-containing protein [Phycisphaerae bacterium]|nr:PilZ domain-containing protein [Phycisphaerae bacterium]
MADEPIPLYDGEPSGAIIRVDGANPGMFEGTGRRMSAGTQSRRRTTRRDCERIHVCLTPDEPEGRIESVECPVFDISKGGAALEFDRPLASGISCQIAYLTVSRRPVRVSGSVRHCRALGEGRFRIGIRFDRTLTVEELKPAKRREGWDIAPGVRARALRVREEPQS